MREAHWETCCRSAFKLVTTCSYLTEVTYSGNCVHLQTPRYRSRLLPKNNKRFPQRLTDNESNKIRASNNARTRAGRYLRSATAVPKSKRFTAVRSGCDLCTAICTPSLLASHGAGRECLQGSATHRRLCIRFDTKSQSPVRLTLYTCELILCREDVMALGRSRTTNVYETVPRKQSIALPGWDCVRFGNARKNASFTFAARDDDRKNMK